MPFPVGFAAPELENFTFLGFFWHHPACCSELHP
jgi:hypothetical protein